MKIFISTPMTGRKEEDIVKDLDLVREKYPTDELVLCYDEKDLPKDVKIEHLFYLSEALQELATCDKVIFMPGWEESRGCQIESMMTGFYNIPKEIYTIKK